MGLCLIYGEINLTQPKVFLTLNLPDRGLTTKPIVASHNLLLLRLFKKLTLNDWEQKLHSAYTQEDAIYIGAELDRLRAVMDIFIPGNDEEANGY